MDFLTPEFWSSLLVLTLLEIVLGIDNILFISILSDRLPVEKRSAARKFGLTFALVSRVLLLLTISWAANLTSPLFSLFNQEISIKDLILIIGGLFLMFKAATEIFKFIELSDEHINEGAARHSLVSYHSFFLQVVLIDLVFSLDSIITAVGLATQVPVMVLAVVISMVFMVIFSDSIATFVGKNPTIKILALSFLIMIGVLLVADGLGEHFNRGYVYFGLVYTLIIELLNMRRRKKLEYLKRREPAEG